MIMKLEPLNKGLDDHNVTRKSSNKIMMNIRSYRDQIQK